MEFTKTKTTATRFKIMKARKDFLTMTPCYREIRGNFKDKMDSCKKCGRKFLDGEGIGLAVCEGTGNIVLCSPCIDELAA